MASLRARIWLVLSMSTGFVNSPFISFISTECGYVLPFPDHVKVLEWYWMTIWIIVGKVEAPPLFHRSSVFHLAQYVRTYPNRIVLRKKRPPILALYNRTDMYQALLDSLHWCGCPHRPNGYSESNMRTIKWTCMSRLGPKASSKNSFSVNMYTISWHTSVHNASPQDLPCKFNPMCCDELERELKRI